MITQAIYRSSYTFFESDFKIEKKTGFEIHQFDVINDTTFKCHDTGPDTSGLMDNEK